MEADFLDFFQQAVTIDPWISQNAYGEALYGVGLSHAARVQQKVKMIRNVQGQEVVSTSQVYIDGIVQVTAKDRVTMPDGMQPLIQAISSSPDETGEIHHKVVYL